MNEPFRMQVREVFRFRDGTTVFAGEVTEGPPFIKPGIFELSVDGNVLGQIKLDGERSRGCVPGVRSVSTTQELSFDSDALKDREVYFAVLERV